MIASLCAQRKTEIAIGRIFSVDVAIADPRSYH